VALGLGADDCVVAVCDGTVGVAECCTGGWVGVCCTGGAGACTGVCCTVGTGAWVGVLIGAGICTCVGCWTEGTGTGCGTTGVVGDAQAGADSNGAEKVAAAAATAAMALTAGTCSLVLICFPRNSPTKLGKSAQARARWIDHGGDQAAVCAG